MSVAIPAHTDLNLPHSPFTSLEAEAAGIASWQLSRLVKEGVLRRLLRDVYVAARLEDTIELRARAAARVVSPHAVVVDRTAAWLWGVDVLRPEELNV